MFRRKVVLDATKSLRLYRDILKVIKTLEPSHQRMYYDYTRLKFGEHQHVKSTKELDKLIVDAREELEWVKSVVSRKQQGK